MEASNEPQRQQVRESMARLIGAAAAEADRLGLFELVRLLREAELAARRGASSRPNVAPDPYRL